MPQLCTVCTHPDHHVINLAIVRGQQAIRAIACQFKINREALRRHREDHLPEIIERSHSLLEQREADEVLATYLMSLDACKKLLDACLEHLADPDRPDRLTLDARASNIQVIYDDYKDLTETGKPRRKRSSLQYLLMRVEKALDIDSVRVEHKQPAPSELLPKVIAQLRPLAELKARLEGRLQHGDKETETTTIQLNVVQNILVQAGLLDR